jgi:hypothetical protein
MQPLPPIPPHAVPIPIPDNDHVLCTRGKRGFHLLVRHLNLTSTPSISPIPTSYKRAHLDPFLHSAMRMNLMLFFKITLSLLFSNLPVF